MIEGGFAPFGIGDFFDDEGFRGGVRLIGGDELFVEPEVKVAVLMAEDGAMRRD